MAIYSNKEQALQCDEPLHPGDVLKEELEARGIKQKDFATDIGLPVTQLNEIINGKRIVSSELAVILEAILGIDASFWTGLQADFDLAKARSSEKVIAKTESVQLWAYVKQFVNVNYLRKTNVLNDSIDGSLEQIQSIFNISKWEELEHLAERPSLQYYRQSPSLSTNDTNLLTWLNYVRYCAVQEQVNPYKPESIDNLLTELKGIFLENQNIIERTKAALERCGIIFLIKEKLEGVNVDGVAFWGKENPVIVLTLRHKRIDNFIFTLFHELAHVRLHLGKNEVIYIDDTEAPVMTEQEKEANNFASSHLIPEDSWKNFIRRVRPLNDANINMYAAKFGVLPAVVRGRLCKEKLVAYNSKTTIDYSIY
ncbi:HigA family addiction module antitoxin [Cytophagaceae bacterium DM2B3-1]|uniref:HigA family addiction module antitoxin n=1 Tax=Xanthocytophaga flava TaxID=3048013 RepID=A0ABT7CL90_9BACT|nr:HigA family addiction module antitoxin [Xanthocytophaga flavus]MDJ1494519.1 HigA family addiction module antitoxin [Xanthocytophaga flavus]